MPSKLSDRIFGLLVAVVALAFFASATQLEEPFFSDPLGPSIFPYLISIVAIISAITMILRPDAEPEWPVLSTIGRIIIAVVVLIIYANILKPLGFLLPTALTAGLLSFLIKPQAIFATLTGVGLSAGLFIIFKYALGLGLFAFPRVLFG